MYLPMDKAELIPKMLVDGSSISAIERITGVYHGTILRLLVLAGERCERIMGQHVRNMKVRDLEFDERWSFIGKKRSASVPTTIRTWTIATFSRPLNAPRNCSSISRWGNAIRATTDIFVKGVRHAMAPGSSCQVTTDGFAPYKTAIANTPGDVADDAMLIKVYQAAPEERRYSPAEVSSVEVVPATGRPDPARICTSIVERSNLSVRMGTRRFTRLTNAFSKKWENHWAAVSLWYGFYNFCRIHKSLRVTPAVAAGISDHVWNIGELLA